MKEYREEPYSSDDEKETRLRLVSFLKNTKIPDNQLLANLGLFIEPKHLSRILMFDDLYRQIVGVHGDLIEFGTRWGNSLALWSSLRGIYEPFNPLRKIVGFDTFSGFPGVSRERDGTASLMKKNRQSVEAGHERTLNEILSIHEELSPLSHIRRFEICKGDAPKALADYLRKNRQTVVALAYFDFNLYRPTLECLRLIRPRLTKGSVVAFDELNYPDAPGETEAVVEELGLGNIRLRRFRYTARVSYFVVGE